MRGLFTIFFISYSLSSLGQDVRVIDQILSSAFHRINYWDSYITSNDYKIDTSDSLGEANDKFQKLLLKYTTSNPKTLYYDFKDLVDSGLRIVTSEDGLFRIYTWDDDMGGTMRYAVNVYQYQMSGKVYSESTLYKRPDEDGPDVFYTSINDFTSKGKAYYITQAVAILSSADSYHSVNVFSIDSGKLIDAKLIKTKSGIKNQLGYEVDLSDSANRDRDVPDYSTVYDKQKEAIILPIIAANGAVTTKKIIYQFNGQYFERL